MRETSKGANANWKGGKALRAHRNFFLPALRNAADSDRVAAMTPGRLTFFSRLTSTLVLWVLMLALFAVLVVESVALMVHRPKIHSQRCECNIQNIAESCTVRPSAFLVFRPSSTIQKKVRREREIRRRLIPFQRRYHRIIVSLLSPMFTLPHIIN